MVAKDAYADSDSRGVVSVRIRDLHPILARDFGGFAIRVPRCEMKQRDAARNLSITERLI